MLTHSLPTRSQNSPSCARYNLSTQRHPNASSMDRANFFLFYANSWTGPVSGNSLVRGRAPALTALSYVQWGHPSAENERNILAGKGEACRGFGNGSGNRQTGGKRRAWTRPRSGAPRTRNVPKQKTTTTMPSRASSRYPASPFPVLSWTLDAAPPASSSIATKYASALRTLPLVVISLLRTNLPRFGFHSPRFGISAGTRSQVQSET